MINPGGNGVVVIIGDRRVDPLVWGGVLELRERGAPVSVFCVHKVPTGAPEGVRVRTIRRRKTSKLPKPSLRRTARRSRELALAVKSRDWRGYDEVWLEASQDTILSAEAQRARMIVAVDRAAVPVVWRLGRVNSRADLVFGYGEATRRLAPSRTDLPVA